MTREVTLRPIDLLCRATAAEKGDALPGDADIADPVGVTDHSIDLAAPPCAIGQWLIQMGGDRAGGYSYDRLDNASCRSARTILPEFQPVCVGTLFLAMPVATDCFILVDFEPERFLLLGGPGDAVPEGEPGSEAWRAAFNRANWIFRLTPVDGGRRLHARSRLAFLQLGRRRTLR